MAEPEQEPRDSWGGHGWLLGPAIAVAGTLLVVALVWWLYAHDAPPPDDADLRFTMPVIPYRDNGLAQLEDTLPKTTLDFSAYADAHGVSDEQIAKIMDGTARNDEIVNAYLIAATPMLERLNTLLARPRFEYTEPISINTEIPSVGALLNAAKTLSLRALRREQLADYAGAARDVLQQRRLAQRLGEGYPPVVLMLTAIAVDGIANESARHLINDPAAPASALAELAQGWGAETPWAETFRHSMQREYLYQCQVLELAKQGGGDWLKKAPLQSKPPANGFNPSQVIGQWMRFNYQPNRTRERFVEYFRARKDLLFGHYAAAQQLEEALKREGRPSIIAMMAGPNGYGRFLYAVLTPTLGNIAANGFLIMVRERLVRTALALRQYYDDHQVLPAKLADLVPQYLAAVPEDPFDGQPLRYDPERRILYTVGKEMADRHGSKFAWQPTSVPGYDDPWYDEHQPTLELKFAQKPGP